MPAPITTPATAPLNSADPKLFAGPTTALAKSPAGGKARSTSVHLSHVLISNPSCTMTISHLQYHPSVTLQYHPSVTPKRYAGCSELLITEAEHVRCRLR